MTTTQNQSDQGNAGRTGLAIGGGILASVGAVLALGGGGILAIGGSDGTFSSGHRDVSSTSSALVSEVAKINGTAEVTDALGHPRLRINADSVNSDKNVFVGVGPKAQVDRYLAGASIDKVNDFEVDPWSLDKTRREGSVKPKPPATQSFWVAKSAGSTAMIDWKVRDGNYRVVVMNADGSRGVATQSEFEIEVPHLATLATVMLILGLVVVGGGIAMMIPAMRSSGSSRPQAPGTQTYAIG
ncbi:MAG: hypothetical protein QOH76_3708 [Thermoleophilaceae bacterium]|jgi:hypothetical protein|nr:hypothetical protein [Thermoleophilaceae bacterium]